MLIIHVVTGLLNIRVGGINPLFIERQFDYAHCDSQAERSRSWLPES